MIDATEGDLDAALDRLVPRRPTIDEKLAARCVSAGGRVVAESTLTAIMGRRASCSGKGVAWDLALASDET